jgi:phosphoribosylformylglycinamidine cyclo-ligase
VLPRGAWVEVDRSTWSPQPVFRILADWGELSLEETEGTWNLGVGMIAVVSQDAASAVTHALTASGLPAWVAGRVSIGERDLDGFEQGAKGVDGGAVKLVGTYAAG